MTNFRLEAGFHDPTLPLIHVVIKAICRGELLFLYHVEERILHSNFGYKILKLAGNHLVKS